MARKPTKEAETTAVANWDEELARLAGAGGALTNSEGGGRFFSTRAGVLAFDETPLPGNQMCVIIGAWCLENVFYTTAFDADNRTPPTCFAFCKNPDEKEDMGPPEIVDKEEDFTRQSDHCSDCEQNQWGSAEKGRGKACSNRRRLACIPAGVYTKQGKNGGYELEVFDDADHFKSAEVAYLKVPVMSGKGFDGYVKQVAEQLRKPLFAVFTRVYLEPDPKSQFRVNFELIEEVPNELIKVLMDRHRLLQEEIDFPYIPFKEEEGAEQKGGSRQSGGKKLATKGGAKGRR